MRNLRKAACPEILKRNATQWLQEYLSDPTSSQKRHRYRHPSIKSRLKEETHSKCVYCESKIGHNTPGDAEHIKPVSKSRRDTFEWTNLTIACTECNRRKGDYYDKHCMLLNPYTDNVEEMVRHLGPLVTWQVGNERAETTIRRLELDSCTRTDLISRKIEKIEEVKNLAERIEGAAGDTLRKLLELKLEELSSVRSEFSGMVVAVIRSLRDH